MEANELLQKLETIIAKHGNLYVENAKGALVTVEVKEKDGEAVIVIS